MKITFVYDNYTSFPNLTAAWGFSCLIEHKKKTILFDTGGDGTILLANMGKSGINPKEIDLIVLSHIHGDHVGGLHSILEKNHDVVDRTVRIRFMRRRRTGRGHCLRGSAILWSEH